MRPGRADDLGNGGWLYAVASMIFQTVGESDRLATNVRASLTDDHASYQRALTIKALGAVPYLISVGLAVGSSETFLTAFVVRTLM